METIYYSVETARSIISAPNNREYKIKEYDTLYNIAKLYLGDGERWQEIMKLNTDLMDDPENLKIGLTIRLPERRGAL